MLRKVGLAISYLVAILYIFSIGLPAIYCLQHGCHGPELDGFMPAFMFTPVGGIATAFALRNAIHRIRTKQSGAWLLWPLAVIFAIVLLGIIALILAGFYYTAFRRR